MLQAVRRYVCAVNEHGLGGHLADILAQSGQCAHVRLETIITHLEDAGRARSRGGPGPGPLEGGPDLRGVHLGQLGFIGAVRLGGGGRAGTGVNCGDRTGFRCPCGFRGFLGAGCGFHVRLGSNVRPGAGFGLAALCGSLAGLGLGGLGFIGRHLDRKGRERHGAEAQYHGQNKSQGSFHYFLHSSESFLIFIITAKKEYKKRAFCFSEGPWR